MEVLVQILLSLIAFIGVVISIFGLPGSVLIFFVLVLAAFITGFTLVTGTQLLWMGSIAIASLLVDNLLVVFGAKKYGATKHGMLGAFLGGLIGVLALGPLGIIIGPFIGAVLLELVFNPDFKKALNAGFGTFMGFLSGIIVKLVITIGLFIWLMNILW